MDGASHGYSPAMSTTTNSTLPNTEPAPIIPDPNPEPAPITPDPDPNPEPAPIIPDPDPNPEPAPVIPGLGSNIRLGD